MDFFQKNFNQFNQKLILSEKLPDKWIMGGVYEKTPYYPWQSRGYRLDSDMLHKKKEGIAFLFSINKPSSI